tara:strand:+ start:2706 stop:4136 length:1431 start_codon:yes stop_codon:yes gene_type:complete
MSILNDKEKVFGNISALRTLTDDFPKLNISNSFPSVNSSANPQQFLIDLVLSLTGFEELKETLIDILAYASETIEVIVKDALKVQLKSLTSCGVDPSLPDWVKSTGAGVKIKVSKIDFFNIFKVDPTTQAGGLMYENVPAGVLSTDFNTFLYYTIQDEGNLRSWNTILDFEFNQNASVPFNTLTINSNLAYDTKTLTELNNDFIDSISLFPSTQLITKLIDGLFGSVSVDASVNKSESQLEMEEQINTVIECITNADDDYVIDNTYFEFSDKQLQDIKEVAANRRNGIRQIKTCGDVDVNIPIEFLTDLKEQFAAATGNREEQRNVMSSNLSSMANQVSRFAGDPVDDYTVQLDFMGLMFTSLIKAYVNAILGPKIISIFLLNYKIVYGQSAEFIDPVDLLKQNKVLINNIINVIRDTIITILLQLVLKYITKLLAANQIGALKEKANAQLAILLSLTGVPQSVIRLIRENSPISF